VPLLDPVRLAEHLGPDWTILVRGHYFYGDVAAGDHARVVDASAHPSIEELSIASDLLVTDYSSLMFDYAVLNRPIVIYAPDWDEYRTQRGTNFDLMAEPPGAVATNQDELADLLRSGRYDDDASTRLRAAFRERFTSLEDGRAAERVVRRLWPVPSAH
jgi:CDP-glycerol glycerophosphotransferase